MSVSKVHLPDKSVLAEYLTRESMFTPQVLNLLDAPPSSLFPDDDVENEEEMEMEEAKTLNYSEFLDFLRETRNKILVEKISTFIASLQQDTFVDIETSSERIKSFLQETEDILARYDEFQGNDSLLDSVGECLEKYVMTKLYQRLFGMGPLDRQRDFDLHRNLESLKFLEPRHLDIPAAHYSPLTAELAQNELRKMDSAKCPRDKLVCILTATQIISKMLNMTRGDGSPPGADEIFPVLVLTLVKANPPKLHSNMQFISNFRPSYRMNTELAYCYTHLVAAACFIESLNVTSLSGISEEQFRTLSEQARCTHAPPASSQAASQSLPTEVSPHPPTASFQQTPAAQCIDDLFSDSLLSADSTSSATFEKSIALLSVSSEGKPSDVGSRIRQSSLFEDDLPAPIKPKPTPSSLPRTSVATERQAQPTKAVDIDAIDKLEKEGEDMDSLTFSGAITSGSGIDESVRALFAAEGNLQENLGTPSLGTYLRGEDDDDDGGLFDSSARQGQNRKYGLYNPYSSSGNRQGPSQIAIGAGTAAFEETFAGDSTDILEKDSEDSGLFG